MTPRTNVTAAAKRAARDRSRSTRHNPVRTTPVRITLDLDPGLYEQLHSWRREAAAAVHRNVTVASLSRALYALLLDAAVAKKARRKLRDQTQE